MKHKMNITSMKSLNTENYKQNFYKRTTKNEYKKAFLHYPSGKINFIEVDFSKYLKDTKKNYYPLRQKSLQNQYIRYIRGVKEYINKKFNNSNLYDILKNNSIKVNSYRSRPSRDYQSISRDNSWINRDYQEIFKDKYNINQKKYTT